MHVDVYIFSKSLKITHIIFEADSISDLVSEVAGLLRSKFARQFVVAVNEHYLPGSSIVPVVLRGHLLNKPHGLPRNIWEQFLDHAIEKSVPVSAAIINRAKKVEDAGL